MSFPPSPDLNQLDELTEEHLGFSALSPGLGFHKNKTTAPMAPEAPVSGPSAPAGAMQAGPALPAPVRAPKVTTAPAVTAPVAKPTVRDEPLAAARDPGAGAVVRTTAFLVDLAIATVPFAAARLAPVEDAEFWNFAVLENSLPSAGFIAAYLFVYFLLAESLGGQSPGKMLLQLQVVEDDKYQKPIGFLSALLRTAALFVGTALAGIGLLWVFADTKRRALHDKWTGTIVRSVRKRS